MHNEPELLDDRFWETDGSDRLHTQTVLKRIRQDLSKGRPEPITVNEVWELAQQRLGVRPESCRYAADECGRPLCIVGAAWAHVAHGIPVIEARAIGRFLGSTAAPDTILGGPVDAMEKRAWKRLERRLGRQVELNAQGTGQVLDDVLAEFRT